jgi:hypothetical protein
VGKEEEKESGKEDQKMGRRGKRIAKDPTRKES